MYLGDETYSSGKGIDANVVLSPFLSDRSAHLVDSGLGGVVGGAGEALMLNTLVSTLKLRGFLFN